MGKLGWIIPVAITGTLVLVAGGFYLAIMDHGQSTYKPIEATNEQVITRQVVKSFAHTHDNKEIDFHIDSDSLNQILYNSTKSLREDPNVGGMFGDFYLTIKDRNYTFYVNLDLKVIKTRAILNTVLSETDDEYIFTVKSVKLGNLGATWIAEKAGVLEKIDGAFQNAFQGTNLSIKSDLKNKKLTYAKEDMHKDMINLMSSSTGSEDDSIFMKAIKSFDFNFSFADGMHVKTDLSNKIENTAKSDSHIASTPDSHYYNYEQAKTYINNGMEVYKSLIKGGAVTDQEAKEAAEIDFKMMKTLGDGSLEVNNTVKNRIKSTNYTIYGTSGTHKVAYITEDEIDEILLSTGIIGDNYLFHYDEESVYVVIDRFYCDLFTDANGDSYFNYTVGININGLETRAIIETKCEPIANSFTADFKISNIYYGETVAGEDFQAKIKDYFKSAIDSMTDNAWITYEPDDGMGGKLANTIRMNFDRLVDTEGELAAYKTAFDTAGGTREFSIDKDAVGLGNRGSLELFYAK